MSEIVIPVKSLSHECRVFDYKVDENFTSSFADNGIIKADCDVHIEAEKKTDWVEIVCNVNGYVTVLCDRCLDPLKLPVEVSQLLTVRFDKEPDDIVEEDDNVIVLNDYENELDLGQSVYDFICLSIPLKRVHSDGECNPQMLSKIGNRESNADNGNSPFYDLKKILENNNN
ncbi:MAG: DUF177 domain-containing protein [Bacteroidales bacterium]|nr:DUF177 domain-containing protein [Bacteroidales bacterium]